MPYLAALLRALGTARAGGAVRALVARDPARHADPDDLRETALLVTAMHAAGPEANDATRALAGWAAGHCVIDGAQNVASLLRALRAAGQAGAARRLLDRDPARLGKVDFADSVAWLLTELREAGAGEAIRTPLARDPARHVDLNDPQAIARLVAELAVAGDVQAVRYARARGVRIAPQGTGHGAAPLEPLDGAMLLRTTRMRKVRIDPAARTARAEAGAVWQDVTVPAGQHGLAGSSPNVGVTGYTLGGGLGWLARRYGLAANSVTAAELVTPGGDLVRADAGHEPDLFWAVRGGGGVGVVTALEMRLYPVRELCAGGSSAWTGTCVNSEKRARAPLPRIGRSVVGREIRIGLMLTAAACLVAVLVDWAVKELSSEATQAGIEAEQASVEAEQASVEAEQASVEAEQAIVEAEQAIVEAGQEDTGRAQDATAESHDQGVR